MAKILFLKIGMATITYIMYTIMTIYQIFFYQEYETKVKDSEYIPKSKRNHLWKWINPMKTWLSEKLKIIEEKVMASKMPTRHKKLLKAYIQARGSNKRKHHKSSIAILVFAAVAMQASGTISQQSKAHFDTDSEPIGIDNRCTGCISHRIEDFDGPLVDSNRSIKGFGGSKTSNVKIGTISWKWLDHEGQSHKFVIPKLFYVPSGDVRLFSPQHWAHT